MAANLTMDVATSNMVIDLLNTKLNTKQQEKSNVETSIADLQKKLAELDLSKTSIDIEIKAIEDQKRSVEANIANLKLVEVQKREAQEAEARKIETQKLEAQEAEAKKREAVQQKQPRIVTMRTSVHSRLGDAIRSLSIPEHIKQQHLRWIDGTDDNDNSTREYVHDNVKYILRNTRKNMIFVHECYVDLTIVS